MNMKLRFLRALKVIRKNEIDLNLYIYCTHNLTLALTRLCVSINKTTIFLLL
jgi:hypothetical protein